MRYQPNVPEEEYPLRQAYMVLYHSYRRSEGYHFDHLDQMVLRQLLDEGHVIQRGAWVTLTEAGIDAWAQLCRPFFETSSSANLAGPEWDDLRRRAGLLPFAAAPKQRRGWYGADEMTAKLYEFLDHMAGAPDEWSRIGLGWGNCPAEALERGLVEREIRPSKTKPHSYYRLTKKGLEIVNAGTSAAQERILHQLADGQTHKFGVGKGRTLNILMDLGFVERVEAHTFRLTPQGRAALAQLELPVPTKPSGGVFGGGKDASIAQLEILLKGAG